MKRKIALVVLFLFILTACGARMPKVKTAEHVVKHYFAKYGHKFKTSDYGKYKLDSVTIMELSEIHKNMISATGQVKLFEGPINNITCILEKKSFGWRVVSWEKM